jgi:exonuclease SbcC
MRIIQIYLHPFAGSVDKKYEFQNGLNVVCGKNEAGKSTLIKALLLALLESTNLTKTEFKNLIANYIPIGGDTINIDLKFEVNGIEYELKKSWGANNSSTLNAVNQASLNSPDTVQAKLFELLNLNTSTVRDVLFTTQAKIATTIDGINKNAEIGSSLDQILRSAILNTGGVVPEALIAQLDEEYESLVQNWRLDEDAPVIKTNNKGAYDNKWEKGLGQILKIAYELYDKNIALNARIQYDQKLTNLSNEINILSEQVNNDLAYVELQKPLVESLSKRKELLLEMDKIADQKKELQSVQNTWNAINANLPVMKGNTELDERHLIQLKSELDNARKSDETLIKITRYDNVKNLKLKFEELSKLLDETKIVTDTDFAFLGNIQESLNNAKNTLSALESAQKFTVEIIPKKNLNVEIQKSTGIVEKTSLVLGTPVFIEVNKGFIYDSDEVVINVKSLTEQIGTLNKQVTNYTKELEDALMKYQVKDFENFKQLYLVYKEVLQDYQFAKNTYESSILGTSFETLELEINELKQLPKTREKSVLEILYNDLVGKIATDKKSIKEFEDNKTSYENLYTSLDKLDDLRLDLINNEKEVKSKLDLLPMIKEGLDIDAFRIEYKEFSDRLNSNQLILQQMLVARASHEGAEPTVLASELQDQIDLLQRQKEQKVEEAKAIKKVLVKLDDILSRAPVNPYENYENNLSQYLTMLTGGKYQVSTEGGITPSVIKNSATNIELPVELLSQGTSGILGLSLRLAMADYYLEGQNGFLAFDDPMVDFDEERQQFAAQCLQQYAEEKQVFIFTCHQAHANQLGGNLINLN